MTTKSTSKKTISTRVTPEVEEFLANLYGTASAGLAASANTMYTINGDGESVCGYALLEKFNVLTKIRQYSTLELKDKFTKDEWFFFADSLNGSLVDSMFRCSTEALVDHCEMAELLDGMAKKYKIDLTGVIKKIRSLTGAQVDALYTHVEKFWNNEDRDLDTWAEEL